MILRIGRLTARTVTELIPALIRGLMTRDGRILTARNGRTLAWR